MDKHYVTAKQLSSILGVTKSSIYLIMHPEKKEKVAIEKAKKENRKLGKKKFVMYKEQHGKINYVKENRNVLIDIDHFLNTHKMFNFKFINEINRESFLKRMEITEEVTINEYPKELQTKDLKEILGVSTYKIKTLRESNILKYRVVEDERYPIHSLGRKQYIYTKKSLLEYIKIHDIKLKPIQRTYYKFDAQFYTVKEIQQYILKQYDFKIHTQTVYRRINDTKEIPAIRIGTLIKVPILEFKQLDLKYIFKID